MVTERAGLLPDRRVLCVLHQALREATSAFLAVLDGYTLADLLAPGRTLAASLGLLQALPPSADRPGFPVRSITRHG
jgi:DNA-binding IscR family transcriptional regulator